jgi:hypothetical protein
LKRRFVATIECDRLFPVAGLFPQMAQTLDMRPGMVAGRKRRYRAAAALRFENRSAISSAVRTASAPLS